MKNIMRIFISGISIIIILTTTAFSESAQKEQKIEKVYSLESLKNIQYLDLETAKKIATANNPSVLAVKERIKQANQQVRQKVAAFFPSVDYTGSGTRQNAFESSTLPETQDKYSSSISVTLTLFNGFLNSSNYNYAKLGKKSQVEAEKDARRTLIWSVSQSYYNAQKAKESIRIEEENRAYNQRQLKDAENKKRLGKGSLSDVLNFKIEVNSSNSALIDARKDYKVAMSGLAALLGVDTARFPAQLKLNKLNSEIGKSVLSYDLKGMTEYAISNRPDYKQYEYSVKQAEKSIKIAESGYYPNVSLSYTHGASRYDDMDFNSDDYESNTSISISFNIFSGGLTKANVSEAKALKKETELTLKNAEINIKSDLNDAFDELTAAQEKYDLQKSNVKLLKINRDLVEKEYRAGLKSLVSLNEAQKNFVKSQSQLIQSLVSVKKSIEKINSYTGKNLIY
ncbi:MAG: TolC family protein [Desulfobacterales bacterium]|nr:TolC family protein [Desulfobacterales bacterium]MCP4158615.1 TolC family protein [Deltaproteobacteria bacterium]